MAAPGARNNSQPAPRVAVVGAGLCGLACAKELQARGCRVTVVDKSGDIGGRLAARRRGGGVWNHGAPKAAAHSSAFKSFLRSQLEADRAECLEDNAERLTVRGKPDMRELCRGVAQDLDLRFGIEVGALKRRYEGWWLVADGAIELGPFDIVLSTMPAPQLRVLLERSSLSAPDPLKAVSMIPCWTLLVGFAAPPPPWRPVDERVVGFESMPIRSEASLPHCHVLHASADWTQEHLELTREAAALQFTKMFAGDPQAEDWFKAAAVVKVHRWRYAFAKHPFGAAFSYNTETGFGFSGDWCTGATAEAAYLNGLALAEQVSMTVVAANVGGDEVLSHGCHS